MAKVQALNAVKPLMLLTEQKAVLDKDFRNFFLKCPIGRMIVAVGADPRFAYVEVNAAAAAYFDIPREKMIGRTPSEIFERENADQIEQSFQSCVRLRRPVTFNA